MKWILLATDEKHLMQDQMGMLKPTLVEEPMSESLTPPALLLGPTSLAENIVEETREEEKGTNVKKTKSADTPMVVGSRAAEDKAAKIQRLKSGFQICKPRGTFMWPNMSLSPHVVTNFDEHTVVPTPTSASSSTTSAPKLVSNSKTKNLSLSITIPSSPFKPLAERRPVSTTTLTHVTGPFSPHLTPPLETTKTTTITKNGSFINLNETPFGQE